MSSLKGVVIGAGSFANHVHYPSLKAISDVKLAAACDLDQQRLEQTCARFEIEKQYRDYRRMLEKEKPDAVYVIMPPHHLFEVVIHCLKTRHNLFIEKPPGITSEQTRQMALLAKKNGCLTMTGFQRRHIPLLKKIKTMAEKKGPLNQVVVSYYKNRLGVGPYYDGAIDVLRCDVIHAVDTLRWLGGEVKSLSSVVRSLHAGYNNSYHALLNFQSKAVGVLMANFAVGRRFFTVEMHAKGISCFADPDDKAIIYRDNKDAGEIMDTRDAANSRELFRYYGFYDEHQHFIDCLKKNREPVSNFSDALKTMELADRIYNSEI